MSFPRSFPYTFGSEGYVPADPGSPPLVWDGAHVAEGQDRLIQQFKDKPRVLALLAAFLNQVQSIEDALWQLQTERRLDNATGAPLTALAKLVGQAREGLGDDGLRAFTRARILLNRSRGRASDVAAVLLAAVNDPAYAFRLVEYPLACFLVRLVGTLPSYAEPTLVARILRLAKAESVRMDIEFSPAGDADSFEWSYASGTDTRKGWGYDSPASGGAWASAL